ncbi:class I SAM-dependent methyltransferase [Pseudonocardia endophytica]|uniref:Methyltransferase family protein n=1 Tax=Pseudonocardia endophytica TaxID=401976 RepID=A0A4R1HCY7_PSEEN|nr:class I SAM-dependent methyltransferase [Pseudonocardia endophytica]TCK19894.1 methyltransferase family protein [Pseudonocardia endophytica]
MIHEDPRAYLLGVEGQALLRAFRGEHDREFVADRLREIRALLDDPALDGLAVDVEQTGTVDGYRAWAPTYDDPANAAFGLETALVHGMLDDLPPGRALDAACGTGRHTAALLDRGHEVIGVDRSPDMLAVARDKIPAAEFRGGDLSALPLPDNEIDVVVCGLALAHLPDLAPAMREFARVLRPGGRLVVSDMHHESVLRSSVPTVRDGDGRPGRLPAHRHLVGDYLRAALPLGLAVERCEEPVPPPPAATEPTADPGPWDVWPWSLAAMVPRAARAANDGVPALVVWRFRHDA